MNRKLAIPPSLEQQLQSSNGDGYRPVIDNLTVELQKLKDELRRYKAQGSCLLRNEQLFEIKINNLPNRKKRELEATLSRFTSNLSNSTTSHPKKSGQRIGILSGFFSLEYLYPLSSSKALPQDSAYGSISGERSSRDISPGQSANMQRAWFAEKGLKRTCATSPKISAKPMLP